MATIIAKLMNDRAVVRVLADGLLAIIYAGGNHGEIEAANKLLYKVADLQETLDLCPLEVDL